MSVVPDRALTLVIGALGGEGGGVLADWVVETAHAAGYPVQATSIPGVAQRTGATTYYVEIFPLRKDERLASRRNDGAVPGYAGCRLADLSSSGTSTAGRPE